VPELCCGAVFTLPAFLAARRGGVRPQAREKNEYFIISIIFQRSQLVGGLQRGPKAAANLWKT